MASTSAPRPAHDPTAKANSTSSKLAVPQSAPKAALDLSDCPYFKDPDHGKCQSGCYDEPRCVTDEPLDGWPSQRAKARPRFPIEEQLLGHIDVSDQCTMGQEEDRRPHRLVLVQEFPKVFWVCIECNPNALVSQHG